MTLLFCLILQIREYCKELQLSDYQISEIMSRLLEDIKLGLGKNTHHKSTVKCFVTYVQDLPNGTGEFNNAKYQYAGGRVLLVNVGIYCCVRCPSKFISHSCALNISIRKFTN
jgi:hexokinase